MVEGHLIASNYICLLTIQVLLRQFVSMLSISQSQIHPPAQAVHMLDQARAICSFNDRMLVPAFKFTLETDMKSVKSGILVMVMQGSRACLMTAQLVPIK